MKKFFQMGGVIAGAFLVLFGIGAIVIGFTGRGEVRDEHRSARRSSARPT